MGGIVKFVVNPAWLYKVKQQKEYFMNQWHAVLKRLKQGRRHIFIDAAVAPLTRPLLVVEDIKRIASAKNIGDALGKILAIALREELGQSPMMEASSCSS